MTMRPLNHDTYMADGYSGPATSHAFRLDALIQRMRNGDSPSRDEALLNLQHRQPAFWSKAGPGNMILTTLLWYANKYHGIQAAWAALERDYPPAGRTYDYDEERWLDYILPLNPAAVDDLSKAYTIVGTFRTRDELRDRTEKAEGLEMSAEVTA